MKKLKLIILIISTLLLFIGCENRNTDNDYTFDEIIQSAKDAGYTVEDSDIIDGGYDVGDKCVSILIPTETNDFLYCFISSYKDEDKLKKVISEIENSDFHTYTQSKNTIAIYGKHIKNIDTLFKDLLLCKPPKCGDLLIVEN